MFTKFLSTRTRSRNAKVRARRSTLESLETRQLLSGSTTLTFGQTLHQVAPTTGVDSHGTTVAGSYSFTGLPGNSDISNQVLHANTTANPSYTVTETFKPTDTTDAPVVDNDFSVTVYKANWEIVANNVSGTYNGLTTPLDGTIRAEIGNTNTWTTFTESSGAPSSANAYMPAGSLTYSVTGLGTVTGLTDVITNGVITPVVNSSVTEWDGVALSNDINFLTVAGGVADTGTANITPATSAVTSVTDAGGTYNGSAYPATVVTNPAGMTTTLDYSLLNTNGTVKTDLGAVAPITAGSYEVTAYVDATLDFNQSATSAPTLFSINLESSQVSVGDAGGTYNASAFAAIGTVDGGSSLENVPVTLDYQLLNADGTVKTNLGANAPVDAGSYAVTANFAGSADYAAGSSNTVDFTIGKATLTVAAVTDTKVFDGTSNSSKTPTITGLQGKDTATAVQQFAQMYAGSEQLSIASYAVTDGNGDGQGANNYILSSSTAAGTINKATLTITAVAGTKVYDGTVTGPVGSTPTYQVSDGSGGDVKTGQLYYGTLTDANGDTGSSPTETFNSKDVNLANTLNVTGYKINDGNGSLDYNIVLVPSAVSSITPLAVAVTVPDQTVTYGTAPTFTVGSGYAATIPSTPDNLTVASYLISGTTSTSGNYTADTAHTITPVIGPSTYDQSDYTITDSDGHGHTPTLTVNPLALTVTPVGANKVYDGSTSDPVTWSYSSPIANDKVTPSVLVKQGTYATFSDANVGTGKIVTLVTGQAVPMLSGTDDGNYTLSFATTTTTANITARPLTVNATATGKLYGQSDPSLTYTLGTGPGVGLVNGDSMSGALSRNAGENAGIYAINQNTLTAGSNYSITYNGANFTISASPTGFNGLTVNGASGGFVYIPYGTPTITVAGTLTSSTGVSMAGQTITVTTAQGDTTPITLGAGGAFNTTINTATLPVGNYPVVFNFSATNNFLLTYGEPVDVTVVKANLTIGATPQYQVFYEGFVNGDTAATLGLNPTVTLGTDGKTLTPVLNSSGLNPIFVNYNPVILTGTLPAQTSPPNLIGTGGGSPGGTSGGSWGATGWVNNAAPDTTDGQLVLDTNSNDSTYGQFVVKKHSIFNKP